MASFDHYRFVGRSRMTGEGGPREARVTLPDGSTTWAEEGSILWDRAERRAPFKVDPFDLIQEEHGPGTFVLLTFNMVAGVEGSLLDLELFETTPRFPLLPGMRVRVGNINGGDSLDITDDYPKASVV